MGRYVTVTPLVPAVHGESLWSHLGGPQHAHLWTYLHWGPFPSRDAFMADLEAKAISEDWIFFAIVDRPSGGAVGYAAYMRAKPGHGSIEIGGLCYGPRLQRTRGATEAMYLMARHAFEELGYRRYEWKCHALNAASRRAALRLGFVYEGTFRQHQIIKGRSRDSDWYSMLRREWPDRKRALERWLDPANFDADGRQRQPLASPAPGAVRAACAVHADGAAAGPRPTTPEGATE